MADNARHRALKDFLCKKLKEGCGTVVQLLSPSEIITSERHAPLPAEEVVNRFEKQFIKGMLKGVKEQEGFMANLEKMKAVLVEGEAFGDGDEAIILPEAEKAKNQGNVHHKRNEHLDAKAQYTEGIELLRNVIEPSKAVHELQVKLLSNRCITLLKYAATVRVEERVAPIVTVPYDVAMALSTPWQNEIPLALRKKLMVRENDAHALMCYAKLLLARRAPGFRELADKLHRMIEARRNVDCIYYVPNDASSKQKSTGAKKTTPKPKSNSKQPEKKKRNAKDKPPAKQSSMQKQTVKQGVEEEPRQSDAAKTRVKPQAAPVRNGKRPGPSSRAQESDDDMPGLVSTSESESDREDPRSYGSRSPPQQSKASPSDSDSDLPGLISSTDSESNDWEASRRKQEATATKPVPKAAESDDELPDLVSSTGESSEDEIPITATLPPPQEVQAKASPKPKVQAKPVPVSFEGESSDDVPDLVSSSSESEDDYDALRSLDTEAPSLQIGQQKTTAKPSTKPTPEPLPSDDDMPALTGSSGSDSDQEHCLKPSEMLHELRNPHLLEAERSSLVGQSIGATRYDPSEIAAQQLREEEEKREREEKVRRKRRERAKRKKERQRQRKWEAELARRKLEEEQAKEAGPKSGDEGGDGDGADGDDAKEGPPSIEVEQAQAQELEGISGVARTAEPPRVSYTATAQLNSGWDGADET